MTRKPQPAPERPVVDVVDSSYQPSKAELEEDVRIDATPEKLLRAVLRPVTVRHVPQPKSR